MTPVVLLPHSFVVTIEGALALIGAAVLGLLCGAALALGAMRWRYAAGPTERPMAPHPQNPWTVH